MNQNSLFLQLPCDLLWRLSYSFLEFLVLNAWEHGTAAPREDSGCLQTPASPKTLHRVLLPRRAALGVLKEDACHCMGSLPSPPPPASSSESCLLSFSRFPAQRPVANSSALLFSFYGLNLTPVFPEAFSLDSLETVLEMKSKYSELTFFKVMCLLLVTGEGWGWRRVAGSTEQPMQIFEKAAFWACY